MKLISAIAASLLCTLLSPACAELSLGIQPNILVKDPSIYQNITRELSAAIGDTVVYKPENNINRFSKSILRNQYDIVLLEPHIAAWFLKDGDNGGTEHDLLLASSQQMRFKVVTPASKSYTTISDLNGKYVCSPLSPSLAAVAFLNQVQSPVNPPIIYNIKNNAHALKTLQKKRCEAVVIESRDEAFWQQQGIDLKTIYTSPDFPSWVMTLYAIHPPQTKQALQAYLTAEGVGNSAVGEFFKAVERSKTAQFIDSPSDDEYLSYNILPGVVWGW